MNGKEIILDNLVFINTNSETNLLIQRCEKLNLFKIKFSSLGFLGFPLTNKISQNSLMILNSKNVNIFDILVAYSFGNFNPLGVICVNNDDLYHNSYVN